MARENFNDVLGFVHVVREGSFTRAAALLGVSPSALSHAVRDIEAELGVLLLTRTTRSVAPTEAGLWLYNEIAPQFDEIDAEVLALQELHNKPAGTIRITAAEQAARSFLWPRLSAVLRDYPDIHVELTVDYAKTDIIAERYDAGVRLGDQVAKDMIAVRISADQRIAVVATPAYFAQRPVPLTPHELQQHNCINLRLPTHGGLRPWDFQKGDEKVIVRVTGQWVFNTSSAIVEAALAGSGLAYAPETMVAQHITDGRLVRVLDDWCDPYPGYYLYYPSRRQSSRAFGIIVDALRYVPS
jgi:DNA-binding transcriptional LysR family regulator